MARVPRTRERTASPEELAEDRRRCLEAKEKARQEEIRRLPSYKSTWPAKPGKASTRARYTVELAGFTAPFPSTRDRANQLARLMVESGVTRRARVFRVTTIRTEIRGFRAIRAPKRADVLQPKPTRCGHGACQRGATPGDRYCDGHAALHVTHGKNGRPRLQAVTP